MSRSTKDAWLSGPGDLKEAVVEDVPVPGQSVKIRALSATAANAATSEAVETYDDRGRQKMRVDSVKLDILRFREGVVEPSFSHDEVVAISAKFGPAFNKVVAQIVELSGIDRDAVTETDARFPGSGGSEAGANGSSAAGGDARPDQSVGAGAGTEGER